MSTILRRAANAAVRLRLSSVAALIGATLATTSPAATVVNGTFETSNFSGWSTTGNIGIVSSGPFGFTNPAYGDYVVQFNGGDKAPNATLSQTIATDIGQAYTLSFAYGVNSSGGQSIVASVLDAGVGQTLLSSLTVTRNDQTYLLNTLAFTAVSTATILRFSDVATNSTYGKDGGLDNVSVSSAAAVPEPATWGMMILGFGAVGFALRRKRAAAFA